MSGVNNIRRAVLAMLIVTLSAAGLLAQDKPKSTGKPKGEKIEHSSQVQGKPIMWERVSIEQRDLFDGPGGDTMRPNLSKIEFIREEKDGHNTKYRIKDGNGRVWVAKLGREAKPETAAVRLLWGLGYKTEVNYLVPTITIPGKGTHQNVRLEARPDNIERLEEWQWEQNPFVGTNELQGLKMMMVFMTNWDVLDLQNKVLWVRKPSGDEEHYIVSDLGSTFGRLGNNNLPVIYRLGRKTGDPEAFAKTSFVDGVEAGEVKLAYKGKNRGLFKGFTVENARWLHSLLNRLSEKQIRDAFRAGNYSPQEVDMFTKAVQRKISELGTAVRGQNVAERN